MQYPTRAPLDPPYDLFTETKCYNRIRDSLTSVRHFQKNTHMTLPRNNTLTVLAIAALSAIFPTVSVVSQQPAATQSQLDLQKGLLFHFPFQGDAQELVRGSRPTSIVATKLDQNPHAAAFLKVGSELRVAGEHAPKLGTNDFTLAMWVRCDEPTTSTTGDLISHYDPNTQRGFHLTLKTSTGVTSNQPNYRHLQFGIDDNCEGSWRDCGRPGQSILAFALAVHDGDLYAGTCEPAKEDSGRVYRYAGDRNWVDCGAPDRSNSVTSLAVYRGQLYCGTGKYRVAGSSLAESENLNLGGEVFRYGGGQKWISVGKLPNTEAVGGMLVLRDRLYCTSLYKPAGFFRFEPDQSAWTPLAVPQLFDVATQQSLDQRVVSLHVFDDHIFAGSYDGGHVYRFDGSSWRDFGLLQGNTQTYSFANYNNTLHVGTWPSGRVYRLKDIEQWIDEGRLGEELEVMGMLVHNGRLFAGTLPLAQVYARTAESWKKITQLDHTPDVKYRRAWTMAEHDGELFCSTLPSGKIYAYSQGTQVAWGHTFPSGWHHVVASRTQEKLTLTMDGRQIGQSTINRKSTPNRPEPYNLSNASDLRIGSGVNGSFGGQLSDVRIYGRSLSAEEIRTLVLQPPN